MALVEQLGDVCWSVVYMCSLLPYMALEFASRAFVYSLFLWHYFCFIFLFNGIDIAGGMIRDASMLIYIYIYALLTTAILKGLTLRNLCLMFVCTCFI